ncbi:MAG: class I SAM-dependent methyltransferase [Myxococcota bacterium]
MLQAPCGAVHAAEKLSLEEAAARFAETERWIGSIVRRMAVRVRAPKPWRVLDVGAAQGRGLIALRRLGHQPFGVEPDREAIEVAHQLAAREGTTIDLREGLAEAIPFDDASFDLVIATSVMEHVGDLEAALREIHRVLVPGGMFWFNSESSLCPRQNEISGFPAFGWYPDPLKRRIMRWARDHRPALVGYTKHPAFHWWTPGKARRKLTEAGFGEIVDRWDLRLPEEDSGWRGRVIALLRRHRPLRLLGDIAVEGCAFAARRMA